MILNKKWMLLLVEIWSVDVKGFLGSDNCVREAPVPVKLEVSLWSIFAILGLLFMCCGCQVHIFNKRTKPKDMTLGNSPNSAMKGQQYQNGPKAGVLSKSNYMSPPTTNKGPNGGGAGRAN